MLRHGRPLRTHQVRDVPNRAANLPWLRQRAPGRKRSLDLGKYALGVDALGRLAGHIHEAVFALVADKSTPAVEPTVWSLALRLVLSGRTGVGHGTGNCLTVDGVVGALAKRNDLDGGRSFGGGQPVDDPEPCGTLTGHVEPQAVQAGEMVRLPSSLPHCRWWAMSSSAARAASASCSSATFNTKRSAEAAGSQMIA